MNTSSWNDQRIEVIIGGLLRTGVILAAVVVILGAFVYLAHHGGDIPHYSVFRGEPENLNLLGAIVRSAFNRQGSAIIQLGLLLLIATPIARVLFSAIAFAMERDYLYVFMTLIVLGILMYSLLGSSG